MALTYLGSGGSVQRGIELAETSCAVQSFVVRYFPEINERRQNNLGETDGRVVSTLSSREISIDAEVTGSSGVMLWTFVATATSTYAILNDVADFGSPAGGIYLHEATVTQTRADWRKVSFRLESNPIL